MLQHLILPQMDYIFFVYGLAFILLGVVCTATGIRKVTTFPLKWLGLFGFSHGINEWLDMLVISQGDGTSFATARLLIMGISFAFLLEFGRTGLQSATGKSPGRWTGGWFARRAGPVSRLTGKRRYRPYPQVRSRRYAPVYPRRRSDSPQGPLFPRFAA
jgi:hypothetical protein